MTQDEKFQIMVKAILTAARKAGEPLGITPAEFTQALFRLYVTSLQALYETDEEAGSGSVVPFPKKKKN